MHERVCQKKSRVLAHLCCLFMHARHVYIDVCGRQLQMVGINNTNMVTLRLGNTYGGVHGY